MMNNGLTHYGLVNNAAVYTRRLFPFVQLEGGDSQELAEVK